MSENEPNLSDYNRRDFLKGGSVATLMTLMGGVELFGQTNAEPTEETETVGPKVKLAVIGLGNWGRELVNTLFRLKQAEVIAICDTYPSAMRRCAEAAPGAVQEPDYQKVLQNKDIKGVLIATPTHLHKDIVLAALKAGKHVYCEAPLAETIADAATIAAAARDAKLLLFQAGLQKRADPERHFLVPFIRSGACGQFIMARAQWHKKQSWRSSSPKPEREKELNWRLSKEKSLGLVGELGIHALDQAAWFLNAQPVAVSGFGSLSFWKDGRDVPDTVQAVLEFPGGVLMNYGATLANSFDGQYEIFFGSDAAVMLRESKGESKAWMFKEVDSPLLGWEVYARKETFFEETGIALVADASKAVVPGADAKKKKAPEDILFHAVKTFVQNAADMAGAIEDFNTMFGGDDPKALLEHLEKNVHRRPAAGYLEAYHSNVTAIKANEAIMSGKRIELKPEWYQLG